MRRRLNLTPNENMARFGTVLQRKSDTTNSTGSFRQNLLQFQGSPAKDHGPEDIDNNWIEKGRDHQEIQNSAGEGPAARVRLSHVEFDAWLVVVVLVEELSVGVPHCTRTIFF